jgi:hypothetical protein
MELDRLFLEEGQSVSMDYFNEEDVELYRKLKRLLKPYIEVLNFRRFETDMCYSFILIYSVPQVYDISRERLKETDMIIRVTQNFFIVISQDSKMEDAIRVGSHILSTFNREVFLMGQSIVKSKISVLSIEYTANLDYKIISYRIVEILKEMLKDDKNTWVKMIKM